MRIREELGKCTHCKEKKELTEFSKDKRSAYGFRPECKSCERKRGSYYIKMIRFRIKSLPRWYEGVDILITARDIEEMPNICFFCNEKIKDSMHIHRVDHRGDYSINNVVKAHKNCHAKYGGHTTGKNPRKGFGSMDKATAEAIQKKGRENRWIKYKKVAG